MYTYENGEVVNYVLMEELNDLKNMSLKHNVYYTLIDMYYGFRRMNSNNFARNKVTDYLKKMSGDIEFEEPYLYPLELDVDTDLLEDDDFIVELYNFLSSFDKDTMFTFMPEGDCYLALHQFAHEREWRLLRYDTWWAQFEDLKRRLKEKHIWSEKIAGIYMYYNNLIPYDVMRNVCEY